MKTGESAVFYILMHHYFLLVLSRVPVLNKEQAGQLIGRCFSEQANVQYIAELIGSLIDAKIYFFVCIVDHKRKQDKVDGCSVKLSLLGVY